MNCQGFEERIASYVGGDLTPEEALPVEQHLRSCAACADLALGLESDRIWLSSRPPEVVDIDYTAMRRQIRQEITRSRRGRRWLPALLAAAAILLAAAVTTLRRTPASHRVAPPATTLAEVSPAPAMTIFRRPNHIKGNSATRGSGPEGTPDEGVRPTQTEPELTLEAAMRMFQELEPEPPPPPPTGSDSPVEMRIATSNPNVTIILLQESKGGSQ